MMEPDSPYQCCFCGKDFDDETSASECETECLEMLEREYGYAPSRFEPGPEMVDAEPPF